LLPLIRQENTRHGRYPITADFCTGSIAAGGDGGEGEAMVEPVHGVVEVLEGRLAEVCATTITSTP
jgi:hypothetical protein